MANKILKLPTEPRDLVAFLAGGLFGSGLLVSGMIDTRKVQGWLDFFGDWDPTLAFVLGGAVLPMLFVWRIAERRGVSLLGTPIPDRTPAKLDRALITGSLMFGAGWGIAGFCPGPALVSMASGQPKALLFVLAMLAGMVGYKLLDRFIHAPSKAKLNPS